jgi:DNA-binding beta-propeller fold protein YncE
MSAIASTPIDAETKNAPTSGRLFFLDLSGGRVLSANPDGSDLKTIINEGRKLPDGLVLDVATGHIYWTNMGDPKRNNGSILRSDLNGKNMITIVPPGGVQRCCSKARNSGCPETVLRAAHVRHSCNGGDQKPGTGERSHGA